MRWVLFYMRAFIFALIVSTPVMAGDADDIENTIRSQFEAFQRDDFDQAFTYASPTIKRIFVSPDNFGRMVRQGYPMVWRPASYRFLGLQDGPDGFSQIVEITDQQSVTHYLRYAMINTPDGWQINGVEILRGNPLAV